MAYFAIHIHVRVQDAGLKPHLRRLPRVHLRELGVQPPSPAGVRGLRRALKDQLPEKDIGFARVHVEVGVRLQHQRTHFTHHPLRTRHGDRRARRRRGRRGAGVPLDCGGERVHWQSQFPRGAAGRGHGGVAHIVSGGGAEMFEAACRGEGLGRRVGALGAVDEGLQLRDAQAVQHRLGAEAQPPRGLGEAQEAVVRVLILPHFDGVHDDIRFRGGPEDLRMRRTAKQCTANQRSPG